MNKICEMGPPLHRPYLGRPESLRCHYKDSTFSSAQQTGALPTELTGRRLGLGSFQK